ncbi:hypothetical protein ACFPYI_17315 [Halomarina salina]|uniref:Uncharacterized protein n=1 Tax=Halomarina salina TaxID=1872699 RepID=A0ABD5RSH9_9EURY|nr:hypothetical protein [Halomarina salina]
MTQSLRRGAALLAATAGVVSLGVATLLVLGGASSAQALAGGLLAGLFAVVVGPLVVIARRVGSVTDDPATLERRIGVGAGRSSAELDALAEWDERRGGLDDAPDHHGPDRES